MIRRLKMEHIKDNKEFVLKTMEGIRINELDLAKKKDDKDY